MMVTRIIETSEVIEIGKLFDGTDLSPYWKIRENVGKFPGRWEYTGSLRGLKWFLKNTEKFKSTNLENYYTTRAIKLEVFDWR